MNPAIRGFLIILAVVACLVLALIVLLSHPANTADLLAGGIIAAGAGLLIAATP